jgi:hypothetical protein
MSLQKVNLRSIVFSRQDLLASWLSRKIGLVPTPHIKCLGRLDSQGNLIGVVGYDGYNGASVQMHSAGVGNWVNREFLYAAFDYPFRVMDCKVVLGLIPSGNVQAIRFNRHVGFTEVTRIEGAHPDGALILMQMRREECRWLHHPKVRAAMRDRVVPSEVQGD